MRYRPIKYGIAPAASPMPPRLVRQRGLTLVELLVAISVLAFVAVLGWRGLDGIVRARVALTSDLEQTRGMQLAFAQLQNDAAHVVPGSTIPNRGPLVVENGRLTLVRTVFADNQPSQLQVVTYRVSDGVLTRRESAATRDLKELDNLWLAAANGSDASQPVVLQSGVSTMTMRTWSSDGNGWRTGNIDSGLSDTPATSTAPAPGGTLSKGGQMEAAAAAAGKTTNTTILTGLEVALQLQGREGSMLKVFLLGAV